MEQVSEVHSTSGEHDLLIKCYLDDATDIGHFVTERIQRLPGVKDTFTLITFKGVFLRRRPGRTDPALGTVTGSTP